MTKILLEGSGWAARTGGIPTSGSWTPSPVGGTTAGSASGASVEGSFVKQDDGLVQIYGFVSWTSHSGSGQLVIEGLPYSAGSRKNPVLIGFLDGYDYDATKGQIVGYTNGTRLYFSQLDDNTSPADLALDTGVVTEFHFSVTFEAGTEKLYFPDRYWQESSDTATYGYYSAYYWPGTVA